MTIGWVLVLCALSTIVTVVAYLVGHSNGELRERRQQQITLSVGRVYALGGAEFVLTDYSVNAQAGTLTLGFEQHDAYRERMRIA